MLTSLLVSAFFTVSIGARAPGAARCAASTRLDGDSGSVAAVGSALRQHGIWTGHAPNPAGSRCAALHVTVVRAHEGIKLDVRDAAGTVTERVVASADTAALLIESWLRTDITEPLLAARSVHQHDPDPAAAPTAMARASTVVASAAPATVTAAPAEAGPAATATGALVAAPAATAVATAPVASRASGAGLGTTLGMLGEVSVARDGSRGAGAAVTGCVGVGRACLGLTGRFATVAPVGGDAASVSALQSVSGYGAEGLVGADVRLGSGRLAFRPGAAVGLGWVGTRGTFGDHSGHFDAFGPRAEARLAVDVAVGRALAIELAVAGGAGAGATMDRVVDTRDRPRFVSGVVPVLRGGLGLRFGGGL